jgi:hypothetical protein
MEQYFLVDYVSYFVRLVIDENIDKVMRQLVPGRAQIASWNAKCLDYEVGIYQSMSGGK